MTATKTVNGVRYELRPSGSCEGCAAADDYRLCRQLGVGCASAAVDGIWCNTERPDTVLPLEPASR